MTKSYYSRYEPIFGSWHITGELGTGAEGHIYSLSRRDALGNVYYSALKAISVPAGGEAEIESLIAGGMTREEAEKYFSDVLETASHEFELLEKLKGNSNIVSYEDHEIYRREDDFGWDILIRMEELTPLIKYSIYHQMDEAEILKLGADLCKGLELCRKFGIVHRDIKPENIFISNTGSYKIGDFGIARIVEETAQAHSRKGTYSYMAPEIYWGKEYDHRADLYSLGMVMYQYLNNGRMPFMPVYPAPVNYQDNETAFIKRMDGAEITDPVNGSDGLKKIVRKACAYDPENRYSDASAILTDIEHVINHEVVPGQYSAEQRSSRKSKGKKGRIAAVIAVLLLASAGIIYAAIPKEVEDIEVSGLQDGAEIYIEEEIDPTYAVKPDWFKDEQITFEVSDTEILTADTDGNLHAGDIPGQVTLTVKAREYSEEINISVIPKVTEIGGIDETISLTTGNTVTLEPDLAPEKFASEPVSYSMADQSIAAVSEDGTITAVSAGETALTVSAGGKSITSKVVVSNPVVYRKPAASTKSGGRKSSSGSSSGSASKGYFDSGDDESF